MLDPIQAAVRDQARNRSVRVSGGRGSGKSFLARLLADDAAARGLTCLLVGSSPLLDRPSPRPPAPPRLHPILQARTAGPLEHAPTAVLAPPPAAALRAALDPEGARLAARLHAKAAEILSRFDLDADEIEGSVAAAGPDPQVVGLLRLAALDAAEFARVAWRDGAEGRTFGEVADVATGAARPPNEGHATLVLDPSQDAIDDYIAGLVARSPAQPPPELEPLRRALEPWAWRANLSTVRDAHHWADRSADLYEAMASALEARGGFEAALSAPETPPEVGRTLAALRARFPDVALPEAVATCRRAAESHRGQADAVLPFLPRHAGRRLSSLHTGAAGEGEGRPVGETAQRLRSAHHAARRLAAAMAELGDRLAPGVMAQVRGRGLADLADAGDVASENAERLSAALALREIRDAYAATGFGDVLDPASVPPAPALAPPARRAPRHDPASLDLLLPLARPPAAPGPNTPLVHRHRPGEDASPLRADYDVVVVDDEESMPDETIAAVDSLATLTHYVGVRQGDHDDFRLSWPHRQRDMVLANVATGRLAPPAWLGSPKGAGVVVRVLDRDALPVLAAAARRLVGLLRDAGYDAQAWTDAGAAPPGPEADLTVLAWDDVDAAAVGRACDVSRDGVVVLCRTCGWVPPDLGAVRRPPPGAEGWTVVADVAEGMILVRGGKSAAIVREPSWNDPGAETVAGRVGRMRDLGWDPVVEWAGRPRAPGELAALLESTGVAPDPRMILVMRGSDLAAPRADG